MREPRAVKRKRDGKSNICNLLAYEIFLNFFKLAISTDSC